MLAVERFRASRMREIRTSGLMRGEEATLTLLSYSTHWAFVILAAMWRQAAAAGRE